jgi:hypothetical protein
MSRAYPNAALPQPVQILGLKLKPLSLGHVILMKRHDVAFVAESDAVAGIEDLIMGVLICSMTFDEWQKFEESEGLFNEITRWGRRVAFQLSRRKGANFNILEKFCLFNEYVSTACRVPQMWIENEGQTSRTDTPWYVAVKMCLMGQLNYSQTEAMNCPLQQAILEYCRHAESTGAIRLMTEDEIKMAEANS